MMNIASLNDEKLVRLFATVQNDSVILLEDIDRVMLSRNSKDAVTLSGLLNCLDGFASREGCIVIMTTNNASSLDQALIRPGRVDVKVEFSLATDDQIGRFFDRVLPNRTPQEKSMFIHKYRGSSMATVQEALLQQAGLTDIVITTAASA
jgi:chaperone BCS1